MECRLADAAGGWHADRGTIGPETAATDNAWIPRRLGGFIRLARPAGWVFDPKGALYSI
jgi:hypothetical protein